MVMINFACIAQEILTFLPDECKTHFIHFRLIHALMTIFGPDLIKREREYIEKYLETKKSITLVQEDDSDRAICKDLESDKELEEDETNGSDIISLEGEHKKHKKRAISNGVFLYGYRFDVNWNEISERFKDANDYVIHKMKIINEVEESDTSQDESEKMRSIRLINDIRELKLDQFKEPENNSHHLSDEIKAILASHEEEIEKPDLEDVDIDDSETSWAHVTKSYESEESDTYHFDESDSGFVFKKHEEDDDESDINDNDAFALTVDKNIYDKPATDDHEKSIGNNPATNEHEKIVDNKPVTDDHEKSITNTHEKGVNEKSITNEHEKSIDNKPATNEHEKEVNEKSSVDNHEKIISNKPATDEHEKDVNEKSSADNHEKSTTNGCEKVVDDKPVTMKDYEGKPKMMVPKYKLMLNGAYGEEAVIDLISKIRPRFEILKVSGTSHVADIHVTDYDQTPPIKYMIEVKNKNNITKEDIQKYEKDLSEMPNIETRVVGLFLSLETTRIPTVGEYSISYNSVLLSKNYVTEECLSIIFDYIPQIYEQHKSSTCQEQEQRITYEVPHSIHEMVISLNVYHNSISKQMELLETTRKNILQNASSLNEVILNYECLQKLLKTILDTLDIPYDSNSDLNLRDRQKEELTKYIKERKPNRIRKQDMLKMFPLLQSELASYSKDEIIKKFSSAGS